MRGLDQCLAIGPELFENRTQQKSIGGEGMAAAVQSRFDPILRYPEPLLCKVFPLDYRRTVVAYLQDDLLLQISLRVRIEIIELLHVPVEPGVHSGRKDDRRT